LSRGNLKKFAQIIFPKIVQIFSKKVLTFSVSIVIMYLETRKTLQREVIVMAKINTQGWYTFADGYSAWYHGLSAQEKKIEIYKHGAIVAFEPTN